VVEGFECTEKQVGSSCTGLECNLAHGIQDAKGSSYFAHLNLDSTGYKIKNRIYGLLVVLWYVMQQFCPIQHGLTGWRHFCQKSCQKSRTSPGVLIWQWAYRKLLFRCSYSNNAREPHLVFASMVGSLLTRITHASNTVVQTDALYDISHQFESP